MVRIYNKMDEGKDVVYKDYLEDRLGQMQDNDTVYDDKPVKNDIKDLKNSLGDVNKVLNELKTKQDKHIETVDKEETTDSVVLKFRLNDSTEKTVEVPKNQYNDAELIRRIEALEQKPDKDTKYTFGTYFKQDSTRDYFHWVKVTKDMFEETEDGFIRIKNFKLSYTDYNGRGVRSLSMMFKNLSFYYIEANGKTTRYSSQSFLNLDSYTDYDTRRNESKEILYLNSSITTDGSGNLSPAKSMPLPFFEFEMTPMTFANELLFKIHLNFYPKQRGNEYEQPYKLALDLDNLFGEPFGFDIEGFDYFDCVFNLNLLQIREINLNMREVQ